MNHEEKRFQAAVAAMQGFFSVCSQTGMFPSFKEVSEEAVKYADALLSELDRTKPDPVTPQPDADGWIPHKPGDPMPCAGHDIVLVRFRDMEEVGPTSPVGLRWTGLGTDGDIIAWKPV